MKKLIISAISATALLFGFASCSGDLHDMNDAPIVDVPTKIVGAMNYDGENVFSDMVKVDELTSTYTFIYSAGMSANWGSPSDGVAFKVGYEKDNWNTCWSQETAGDTTLADGKGEVVCKAQNSQNISFAGLTDGKTYKITAKAGVASVTVSIEKADDIPSYTLNANGILHSMSYTADGEKGIYKATITPTSDTLELNFFDGTNNYGSSSNAIDVSGKDTDSTGSTTDSSSAIIEKISDTIKESAKFEKIYYNSDLSKYYDYVITLTVEASGEDILRTATIKRIIPKHKVTFKFNVSGDVSADETVFIHGWKNIGIYGFEWPVIDGKFDTSKKTWKGKISKEESIVKGELELVDGKTYPAEECFCVGIVDNAGNFKWQTGDVELPSYQTYTSDLVISFNLELSKSAEGEKKGTAKVSIVK